MIVVIGEALVDVVHATDGTTTAHPGGSPANVAVGLSRLGTPAALLTRLGKDEYGALVENHLRTNGVRLLGRSDSAQGTSVAEATIDRSGVASYDFQINWDLSGDADDASLVDPQQGVDCVHTGSIGAALEPGASGVRRIVERARDEVTVSFDPNCRPALMGEVGAARRRVEELVALAHVVKASDEDLGWLYPGRSAPDVAAGWMSAGPALVCVTLGGGGAYGVVAAGSTTAPGIAVQVADTVGAGDAFMAGLLDGLRRRNLLGAGAQDDLREAGVDLLGDLLGEACVVAAITCSRPGADPPTAAEVAAYGTSA